MLMELLEVGVEFAGLADVGWADILAVADSFGFAGLCCPNVQADSRRIKTIYGYFLTSSSRTNCCVSLLTSLSLEYPSRFLYDSCIDPVLLIFEKGKSQLGDPI